MTRYSLLLFLCAHTFFIPQAQENQRITTYQEEQLEGLAEATDAELKDDALQQQLAYYRKHPLNINTAGADEINAAGLLTGLQADQLISYRRLLGRLVNIYELQAIPGWDIGTIRRILPFITIDSDGDAMPESLGAGWKGGEHSLLLRTGRVLEKAAGYRGPPNPGAASYQGSRDQLFVRYHYNYKNILQWGLLGDKDAGEPFFRSRQKQGFDFYSAHLFAKGSGWIKAIAVGDFTVNMGQGLIQWQGLAFKKNADPLAIKRQGPVLRPYNSRGEYNFHRGLGITLQKNHWEATLFTSFRRIDGSPAADSLSNDDAITAFRTSGYHRTVSENAARGIVRQTAFGARISYRSRRGMLGMHAVQYHFSSPLEPSGQPYRLFASGSRSPANAAMDYSYTVGSLHLFGEAAADSRLNKAFVQGVLISLDAKVDMALLYRHISKAYQSFYSNAFTENTTPANETGLYTGICFRPAPGLQLNAYADLFRFPWLKYRVDAPAGGKDYLLQLSWTPDKRLEIYLRYKDETKPLNRSDAGTVTAIVDPVRRQGFRLHCNAVLNRQWTLRHRLELSWYNAGAPAAEQGFMIYTDGIYQPSSSAWRGSLRLQYVETTGYNARIYAMENDLPGRISVPGLYDKGFHYYFNAAWRPAKKQLRLRHKRPLQLGLRWAQTIYPAKTVIGSGLDAIAGHCKTELAAQLMWEW